MTFKVSKNYLKDKLKNVQRYNSKLEKDALLYEGDSIMELAKILLGDTVILNEQEAEALIYKAREISVSDVIDTIATCNCGYQNTYQISIPEMFNLDVKSQYPIGIFEDIDDIITDEELDKMVLKKATELSREIKEISKLVFNPTYIGECSKCKGEMQVKMKTENIISGSSLSLIYREYTDLFLYTNNNVLSIDEMYPFERDFYLKIVKDKLESKENK